MTVIAIQHGLQGTALATVIGCLLLAVLYTYKVLKPPSR
jgi:hypothetical protein